MTGTWKFRVEIRRKVKVVNTDVEFHQIWQLVSSRSLREQSENSGRLGPEHTKLGSRSKVSYIISELFLTVSQAHFLFLPMSGSSLGRHHDGAPLYGPQALINTC